MDAQLILAVIISVQSDIYLNQIHGFPSPRFYLQKYIRHFVEGHGFSL